MIRQLVVALYVVVTPGRYVSVADVEDDDVPFEERLSALRKKSDEQFAKAEKLMGVVRSKLAGIVVDVYGPSPR